MTSGGRMTTILNGGENFPARRHSRRPIPKRGRVKAGIVIGLTHSFAALFSPIRIFTLIHLPPSQCHSRSITFKRVKISTASIEEEERHKDDYWWKNDDDEWRNDYWWKNDDDECSSELFSKEAFWAVNSEEGKSEGRDSDTVGYFFCCPPLAESQ
ncbi:hypothetical protein NE237_032551 [Protea cynaroides]|uniref:Uncharacterized protein n=1 Tax=Protea cynaroides TaxID=273540 RepID=A0A9Q0L4F6_9MAGN|nr:hypothetical protein NE237_032551 [Protea cynaroides]